MSTISSPAATGEHGLPTEAGEIRLAHLHRYAWCRAFVVGKDVLDLTGGEQDEGGDGMRMLIDAGARSIIGAEGALPEASVDVAFAFATMAHLGRHDAMLAEVARVLRPGGLLMMALPNPAVDNAHKQQLDASHAKALGLDELLTATQRQFAQVRVFGQRLALGSAIYPLDPQDTRPHFDALTDGVDAVEPRTPRLAEPMVFVVLAAREIGALPDVGPSMLLSEREDLLARHHERARDLADGRDRADQELVATRRRLEREVTVQRVSALGLAQELAAERALRSRMERSRSWRVTRPLHNVRVALRDGFKALRRRWSADSGTDSAMATNAPMRAAPPALDVVRVLDELHFPAQATPLVSIIIPCYGQYAHTLACLRSIQQHLPTAPIEVIVVEDASGEVEMDRLATVPGLRYIRREVNLGFLRSCNEALREARGAFIHLLNNDTEVTADWLDSLLDLFNARPDCGLVGSRLLYPDGRQQEAGCIVWDDGNASNYGRLDDPRRSIYGYVRRADYCSAASVLLRTDVFRALGGFDERYLPAYYEDTDLAFRIRERGLEVYYQPESRVIHHEGVTHGTEAEVGIKAHQATNRLTFLDRWQATLKAEHFPAGVDVASARDRAHGRRCLLVVDHYVPQPDRDAGSKAIFQLIETYLEMGWDVKFWPDNLHHDTLYTRALQQLGVEVFYGAEYVGKFGARMLDNARRVDRVLLSRPHIAANYFADIRRHSAATVMYYGHDLHHVRLAEQRRVQPGNTQLAAEEARMRALEESAWAQSDVIYYLSHEEVDVVAARLAASGGKAQVWRAQPYFYDIAPDAQADDLGRRRGLLFVAGFAHAPNVDAAVWFCAEVLPLVRAELPDIELWLVGSNPTPAVQALAGPGVHVTGQVSDGELKSHYAAARVAVAPMRFGAGVKNKVVEAFARGCPLVTTSVGYQGLPELEQASPSADSAAEFAERTLRLLRDDAAWTRARRLGIDFVRSNFSRASMRISLTL